MWYTKAEAVRRFSIWYGSVGLAQIIGGVISWVGPTLSHRSELATSNSSQGFQQVNGESLAGWRIMFVVLGVLTIVVGILTIIFLPDNPMTVTWLTEAEKKAAIERVAINQTGIQNRHFKLSHLKELALDLQIWLLVLITILVRRLTPSIFWLNLLLRSQ